MALKADESGYLVGQDIQAFLDQAKAERDWAAEVSNPNKRYRKFGTIPDVICIEINNKYFIDIHDPEQFKDPATMARFKAIIKRDYPYLLSN
jgi:hypothetical protein